MSRYEYNSAALAASFKSFCSTRVGLSVHSSISAPPAPVDFTLHMIKTDAIRPSASERVRVYPDGYSLYFLLTYHPCPSCPGKNQHTRAHARARGKSFLLSVLLFILKLKVPGQLGQLFNIHNLHSDIHPDALGQPGQVTNRGILCH